MDVAPREACLRLHLERGAVQITQREHERQSVGVGIGVVRAVRDCTRRSADRVPLGERAGVPAE